MKISFIGYTLKPSIIFQNIVIDIYTHVSPSLTMGIFTWLPGGRWNSFFPKWHSFSTPFLPPNLAVSNVSLKNQQIMKLTMMKHGIRWNTGTFWRFFSSINFDPSTINSSGLYRGPIVKIGNSMGTKIFSLV